MKESLSTSVDPESCTGCGLCIKACPVGVLAMRDGKAAVVSQSCIECGHCAAVCGPRAVTVDSLERDPLRFATFAADDQCLPCGQFDTASLVQLMRSRRSCRNYADAPVDRDVLEDLVRIGTTAPSGTNSQKWTFTVLAERKDVLALVEKTGSFYERLNRLSESRIARAVNRVFGSGALGSYYRGYYAHVKRAIDAWRKDGRDPLFHGAAAVIVIGSTPGGSCPADDALLATQNILLAAHAMGLGTCLIGFASIAIGRDRKLKSFLGMAAGETVHSVIALGHPSVKYKRVAGRRQIAPRYLSA